MLPGAATVPGLTGTDLSPLFGPIAWLAVGVLAIALGALIAGLLVERRDERRRTSAARASDPSVPWRPAA